MNPRTRLSRPSPAIVVAVIALVAALAGTAVASDPVATSSAITKKKVKKIAKKQVKKLAPTLSVSFADVSGVAQNVMAATVPVGNSCDITKQTGEITATKAGAPANTKCDVTFPRSIETCSVGATPLHPTADVGGEATVRYLGGARVKVGRYDSAGGTPTAGLFTVTAVCPNGTPDGA